jgi:hypothetical protein
MFNLLQSGHAFHKRMATTANVFAKAKAVADSPDVMPEHTAKISRTPPQRHSNHFGIGAQQKLMPARMAYVLVVRLPAGKPFEMMTAQETRQHMPDMPQSAVFSERVSLAVATVGRLVPEKKAGNLGVAGYAGFGDG